MLLGFTSGTIMILERILQSVPSFVVNTEPTLDTSVYQLTSMSLGTSSLATLALKLDWKCKYFNCYRERENSKSHLFRSVKPGLLFAMLYTWLALVSFIKLAVIVGRELGLNILDEEEIPFYPFR